jgi:hypothetical protein
MFSLIEAKIAEMRHAFEQCGDARMRIMQFLDDVLQSQRLLLPTEQLDYFENTASRFYAALSHFSTSREQLHFTTANGFNKRRVADETVLLDLAAEMHEFLYSSTSCRP